MTAFGSMSKIKIFKTNFGVWMTANGFYDTLLLCDMSQDISSILNLFVSKKLPMIIFIGRTRHLYKTQNNCSQQINEFLVLCNRSCTLFCTQKCSKTYNSAVLTHLCFEQKLLEHNYFIKKIFFLPKNGFIFYFHNCLCIANGYYCNI